MRRDDVADDDREAGAIWQPLSPADLPRLANIAAELHPGLPERWEVMAEKLQLFPAGCRKLVHDGALAGYALAHPWRLFDIPLLDVFLGGLPGDADCLYMHDVAILPAARGRGAAMRYVAHLREVAVHSGLGALACVSVYGTVALWRSTGFREEHGASPTTKLASYGPSARYMIQTL